VTGYGRPGRVAWWLCRPSLGRALLCGAVAIFFGTFIGVDAVTMFCAAQVVRLVLRAPARRPLRLGPALLRPVSGGRMAVEPVGGEADARLTFVEPARVRTPPSDPETELTLDELIAGDPGTEPGDPGPEYAERRPLPVCREDNVPVGSDVAEALRVAVAETR
jgi:hypothetical protein